MRYVRRWSIEDSYGCTRAKVVAHARRSRFRKSFSGVGKNRTAEISDGRLVTRVKGGPLFYAVTPGTRLGAGCGAREREKDEEGIINQRPGVPYFVKNVLM